MTLAGVAFAIRYAPLPNHLWLAIAAAAPFLLLAAPMGLGLLLWCRRWVLAALAAGLTLATVLVRAPLYVAASTDGPSVALTVMTINMKYGRADAEAITALAIARADVVMVQELTPEAVHRLQAAGLGRKFKYHLVESRPNAAGIGLYSRYPITTPVRVGGMHRVMISGRLKIQGVPTELTVASLHLASPWPRRIDDWQRDFETAPGILDAMATDAGDGPVLVAGDFNATVDMRPFRRLLNGIYRDASEQAGSGRQFTFPSNRRIPPFIGIDHVLTRNATAVQTDTIKVPDSDHLALLATVLVPRD
jgi:endonuclease/exonuclease/phosphatase (EEP) superfamily protein YafD